METRPNDVEDIVARYREEIKDKKIFFGDNIPEKKLNNALRTYAHLGSGERPLVLIDTTVFGSAKTGAVLTKATFYTRDLGSEIKTHSIPWSRITSVRCDEKTTRWLLFDESKILQVFTKKSTMDILIRMIRDILRLKSFPIECSVCERFLKDIGHLYDDVVKSGGMVLGGSSGPRQWLGTFCTSCGSIFCAECRSTGPRLCSFCGAQVKPALASYLQEMRLRRRESSKNE